MDRSDLRSRRIIDLSHPIEESTAPFPGDPPVEIRVLQSLGAGDAEIANTSAVSMSLHCGTHMDAPFHFVSRGRTIDAVDPGACVGPAVLVDLASSAPAVIDREHLEPHAAAIESCRRVVLHTGWHRRWGLPEYFEDHPVVSVAAARFLIDRGIVLAGVDFPSVDRAPYATHRELLENGVLIVENLSALDAIGAGVFDLVALPLRIAGRDGSPVRAVALV